MIRLFFPALLIASLLVFGNCSSARAQAAAPVPLVARYDMQPDAANPSRLVDSGPLHLDGSQTGGAAAYIAGPHGGGALHFDAQESARVDNPGLIGRLSHALTITAWVRPTAFSLLSTVVCKRDQNVNEPFAFGLSPQGKPFFNGTDGQNWLNFYGNGLPAIPLNQWTHIAVTFQQGQGLTLYENGQAGDRRDAPADLAANDAPVVFGRDWAWNGGTSQMEDPHFQGDIGAVHIYAAALTPAQIQQDMNGTLPTRAAVAADFPPPQQIATFHLTRYDMPIGETDENNDHGRTRQDAARVNGPDAIDWPQLTLTSPAGQPQPLFGNGADQALELPLRDGDQERSLFQQPYDQIIEPGDHWVRAVKWLWGQNYLYTTDRTARTWMADYELWCFPVKITGPGAADVQSVTLTWKGTTYYQKQGLHLHSLTLLLPQNSPDAPYLLSVNGGPPLTLNVGLRLITVGNPQNDPIAFTAKSGGITIQSPAPPATFPNQKAWDADTAALAKGGPPPPVSAVAATSLARHLGRDVPRSPVTVNMVNLPHGMAGGGYFNGDYEADTKAFHEIGSPAQFAAFLAGTGYDRDFERVGMNGMGNPDLYALAGALADAGVQFGLVPGTEWGRPFIANPNLAFYSATLPDYHAPLFRDLQIEAQRLDRFPNFAGVSIGADNAGYVSYWDWAPPIPNRPWGEAFVAFQGGQYRPAPVAPGLGVTASWQTPGTARQFVDYLDRYNQTFEQYGYFARAVTQVDPQLVATSGSFGSSPGVGAGGGWPWATVPGTEMFAGMPVQQAYDWNENQSSLPMHQAALLDRLISEHPDKPTWALIDDFRFLFGPGPMQRAYALALTRGVQAVGTNFLPNPTGPKARPDVVAAQTALFAWVHRYGGAYALTKPQASLGILFVYPQALMRPVDQGGQGTPEGRVGGGHEGKVTEALFLAHAAGWPAKVITPPELKRGLPPSMKAILLVGLNRVDDTWNWYDGLTPLLKAFVAKGGRILTDDESVVPSDLPVTKTGMTVRSYVAERDMDWTPTLLARNADNIVKLKAAMQGIAPPLAETGSDTVWAIPTTAGDTQYVTVVNQATPAGANASQVIQPQTGHLTWHTARPIYDVRRERRLTSAQAQTVDLTQEAFQYYALPPHPVTTPKPSVSLGPDGFYRASASIGAAMTGVPLQWTVARVGADDSATVYSATGLSAKLPLAQSDVPGTYRVTVTELLSGLSAAQTVTVHAIPKPAVPPSAVRLEDAGRLAAFAGRAQTPLTVALTPAQENDPRLQGVVHRLLAYYRAKGRNVTVGLAGPGGVVTGLQPYVSTNQYPHWKTTNADLVLLGMPTNSVLMLDEARASLLPEGAQALAAGHAAIGCALSPFVGECDALNIVAPDDTGIAAALRRLTADMPSLR